MGGILLLENKGEEFPPHKKNRVSQICMLGTPSILYVGILYVLFRPVALPATGAFVCVCLFLGLFKNTKENLKNTKDFSRLANP